MIIDKLDLLSKGWKTSEIDHATKVLEEAEDNKNNKIKFVDGLLIAVLIALMLANGFVCSSFLVPFIYALKGGFILAIAAVIGVMFSILFTILIYDIEKVHRKHESNLFVAFIVNGAVNFYLILETAARFGIKTNLELTHNIYLVAGTYLVAFLVPHLIYQLLKKREI